MDAHELFAQKNTRVCQVKPVVKIQNKCLKPVIIPGNSKGLFRVAVNFQDTAR